MSTSRLTIILILILVTVPVSSYACGKIRWAIKIGTDKDAQTINVNNSQKVSINELLRKKASFPPTDSSRIKPTEITVYEVVAILTDYKHSDDGDYHLVLQDENGRTMIAELPDPDCVPERGALAKYIKTAREQFDSQLSPTDSFNQANRRVKIKGVGFYDHIHGQRGVAPNGIELHPVLGIEFLD